jgi:hypothetical protein
VPLEKVWLEKVFRSLQTVESKVGPSRSPITQAQGEGHFLRYASQRQGWADTGKRYGAARSTGSLDTQYRSKQDLDILCREVKSDPRVRPRLCRLCRRVSFLRYDECRRGLTGNTAAQSLLQVLQDGTELGYARWPAMAKKAAIQGTDHRYVLYAVVFLIFLFRELVL